MPRGTKKVATPGAESTPKSVKTPGVPETPVVEKRPEPVVRGFGRGKVINDYADAMAKVRSGELKPPVLTSQGWIVEKPSE